MEKKIEDSKPILNRTRRQLLMGAALTPLVMTLHSAKVFAQEADGMNPSGLAPYSAVLIGSAGLNNGGGNDDTECALYNQIANSSSDNRVNAYYGYPGSGSVSQSNWNSLLTSDCGWSFDSRDSHLKWTQSYEAKFLPAVKAYATAVSEIDAAASEVPFTPSLSSDPVTALGDDVNLESNLPSGADKNSGIFKFVCDAKEVLDAIYSSAKAAYNLKVNEWNADEDNHSNPLYPAPTL